MPKGGLARRATAIVQLRQEHANVLLLDSGDSLFRGGVSTELEDPGQGAWVIEAMNLMGYDAIAMGDRELQALLPVVQSRFEEAQFPILSANVKVGSELPNVQPYFLHQTSGGHTVAIVGVTSEQAGQRLAALGLDLVVQDPVAGVRQAVGEAAKSADIVILLSNLKRSETEALAQAVPGIDVIIGIYEGGQRDPVAIPGAEGQVVLQASGILGEYLGLLTLHFDEHGEVKSFEGRSLALTDRYEDDPQIVELFRRYASKP
ncbi:MAG: hypothetical protein JW934_22155 [Anaerolineae bacterium]|nr:hypothetical protein [Anaerolineae bacterium]